MIPAGASILNGKIQEVQKPSLTWKIDFDKGRMAGMTDGLDAVKQAVYCILGTERYRYLIYSFNYGTELGGLMGKSPAYVRSELARRIYEAITQDDRISGIENFTAQITGDSISVGFTVVTRYGNFEYSQEVK